MSALVAVAEVDINDASWVTAAFPGVRRQGQIEESLRRFELQLPDAIVDGCAIDEQVLPGAAA